MPPEAFGDNSRKLEEPSETKHDHCLLLSLPIELRENIYVHIFANVHARRFKHSSSNELAILQTCTKVQNEASSVLFNLTPLRFIIGHRQPVSSIPPSQTIIDHFQNVHFKIRKMNTTHSGYDFDIPFERLTEAFILPTVLRRDCYIQCELGEHAGGYCGRQFQARIKSFTAFKTVTIDFVGQVRKTEFPQEAVADDDPDKTNKLLIQSYREGARQREFANLTDVEKMFRMLEGYLGKGKMLDVFEGYEVLYARRLVFHPL